MARGRKRKLAKREPNGQAQRLDKARAEQAATHVAKEARARLYGVPIAIAGHAEWGSAIGRLFLSGSIVQDIDPSRAALRADIRSARYIAALRYRQLHDTYMAAIDAPERVIEPFGTAEDKPRACDSCGLTVRCEQCAMEWAARTRWQYEAVNSLLKPYELSVLRHVVIADMDLPIATRTLCRALDVVGSYFNQRALAA